MKKISVIVPVYGVEPYIRRCVRSLLSQTLDNLEFIFVDDCSPDGSMKILEEEIECHRQQIAEREWAVRIERMPANSGQAAVRKRGIQLATGEYITHCDSDDWVDSDLYRQLYEKAKSENLDTVYCDHYRTNGENHTLVHAFPAADIDKQGAFDSLFADNRGYHAVWSALYRASLYGALMEYPEANMGEDAALTAQLLHLARGFGYIAKPLYYYYQRPGSIVQTRDLEKRWNHARQLMQNQALIIRFFQQQQMSEKYITFAKLTARFALIDLRDEAGFREAWKACYPEIAGHIVGNRDIPFRLRMKYALLDSDWLRYGYVAAQKIAKTLYRT